MKLKTPIVNNRKNTLKSIDKQNDITYNIRT